MTDLERAHSRVAKLRAIRIHDDPPRRRLWLISTLGDACGCAVLFGLLWLGLAVLT